MNTTCTRALVVALLLAAGLAACGGDDTATASDTPDTTETTATPTTEPAAQADGPVSVVAIDYAFEDLPATIAAGSSISLTNASDVELHELVAFRLPDDEQRTVDELVALPQAELEALFAGPPAMVLLAPPSSDGFPVVGDGTVAEAGRYLAICAIPTGADPEAYMAAAAQSSGAPPQVPGGPPHLVAGMHAEFTVQ